MIPLSQKDRRWAQLKLGESDVIMFDGGCFVVALSILINQQPDQTLAMLNRNNCFNNKGELYADLAAKTLGMNYTRTLDKPSIPCVAECIVFVDHNEQRHFVVWLPTDPETVMDSWDGQLKNNPYKVVSWRLFTKKLMFIFEHPKDPEVKAKKVTWIERIKEYLSDVMDWISKVGFDSVPRRGVA